MLSGLVLAPDGWTSEEEAHVPGMELVPNAA
jgi:hypothetical protein